MKLLELAMDHARDCWAPLAPDTQSLGRVGCCELRPLVYARGAHADAAMRRFAYHGSDASLLYKYVLSPLAAFLVELLPRWVCLLYTSPSPRDRTRSRMPSSA